MKLPDIQAYVDSMARLDKAVEEAEDARRSYVHQSGIVNYLTLWWLSQRKDPNAEYRWHSWYCKRASEAGLYFQSVPQYSEDGSRDETIPIAFIEEMRAQEDPFAFIEAKVQAEDAAKAQKAERDRKAREKAAREFKEFSDEMIRQKAYRESPEGLRTEAQALLAQAAELEKS